MLDRPNLTVLTQAYVHRIATSKVGGEVISTGVEFEHGGQVYTVNVGKETIVSARYVTRSDTMPVHLTDDDDDVYSTVKSPHILELSGIGRPEVLKKIGVPIRVELPGVGENVQDHIFGSK